MTNSSAKQDIITGYDTIIHNYTLLYQYHNKFRTENKLTRTRVDDSMMTLQCTLAFPIAFPGAPGDCWPGAGNGSRMWFVN